MEFGTSLINVSTLGETDAVTKYKRIKLHIWDTAGQELFFSLTRSYYVGAHAALLLFDVTNSLSFDHLPTWIKEVKNNCGNPNLLCILVGSKTDCVHLRSVSQAKVKIMSYCYVHNLSYYYVHNLSYCPYYQGAGFCNERRAHVHRDLIQREYKRIRSLLTTCQISMGDDPI
jgi:small GTP-binding protein